MGARGWQRLEDAWQKNCPGRLEGGGGHVAPPYLASSKLDTQLYLQIYIYLHIHTRLLVHHCTVYCTLYTANQTYTTSCTPLYTALYIVHCKLDIHHFLYTTVHCTVHCTLQTIQKRRRYNLCDFICMKLNPIPIGIFLSNMDWGEGDVPPPYDFAHEGECDTSTKFNFLRPAHF